MSIPFVSRERSLGIGNTPLIPVRAHQQGQRRTLFLKLDGHNPCGSSKDRTALFLIDSAEKRNLLSPSSVVIESTSGNLGAALAFVCMKRGYPFVAVVDPKVTAENIEKMRRLGADIELVSQPDKYGSYLGARLERVAQLCAESTRFVWLNQYANEANPAAHRATTAPEIYRQMNGKVDALFIAVSTGGTLAGVSRYFRNLWPRPAIVAVDAVGSVALGGDARSRLLTGIGSSQKSSFVNAADYERVSRIDDCEAFEYCWALAAAGIQVGGSSGAVVAACMAFLADHPETERPVCLCPDEGKSYASTIYNELWLRQNGISLCGYAPTFTRDGLSLDDEYDDR